MIFKKIFLSIIVLAFVQFTMGQSKVFYKNVRGPFWTKSQMDSFLVSKTNNRYKLVARITGSEKIGDSLVYHVKMVMDPAPVDANNVPLAGQPLPPFKFSDMNGKTISSKSLKGKPVVINFWFTACAPCIAEMPALNVLKNEYKDSDVVFLAMTFDNNALVLNFLKKHPFNFSIIPSAEQYVDHITSLFPITLFVDRKGKIQFAEHLIPASLNPMQAAQTGHLDLGSYVKNINAIMAK